MTPARRLTGELFGTAFLLAAVVGSGIMGERLSAGNVAMALLGNTLATGATLVTVIFTLRLRLGRAFQSGRYAGRSQPGRHSLARSAGIHHPSGYACAARPSGRLT